MHSGIYTICPCSTERAINGLTIFPMRLGGRPSGSVSAERAVQYTKTELEKLGVDKVWLQPVMVPKWTRGLAEYAYVLIKGNTTTVNITALGGSVATPDAGLKAEVIEVQGLEDLARYGKDQIEGKIVFFNRPMRADLIHTFQAYGGMCGSKIFGSCRGGYIWCCRCDSAFS